MLATIAGQAWATAAHPYSLEINGIDRIGVAQMRTIQVEMAGPGSNGSMSVVLEDASASIAVAEWDEIRSMEHGASPRPIQFGGFVQAVKYSIWAAGGRTITITAVGYGILLDRKVVPAQTLTAYDADDAWNESGALHDAVGGIVSLWAAPVQVIGFPPSIAWGYGTDESHGRMSFYNWWAQFGGDHHGSYAVPAQYVRSLVEDLLSKSKWDQLDGSLGPAGGVYWVDSARMLRLGLEVVDDNSYDPIPENRYDDATAGPLDIDLTGAVYAVTDLEYERENTGRADSAYIEGGAAAGTGLHAVGSTGVAGNLMTLVVDSESTTAPDKARLGAAAVGRQLAASVRGQLVIESNVALPIWPGRSMTIDVAQAGLSAGPLWRATAVRISWRTATFRVYTISFGGTAPAPSAMRRTGRFATR